MQNIKKAILAVFAVFVIAFSGLYLWLSGHYVVPILMYHIVDYAPAPEPNWVTPENFDFQMHYLKEHHFNVISLSEYVDHVKNKKDFSRKTIVITFDDGCEDNYSKAFPILKKYHFPATIFLVSSWVDREGFLTVRQIKEMREFGINFGAHSKTHPHLPSILTEQKYDEIVNGKKDLEAKLGFPIRSLAYPFGGFNDEIKEIVKNSGYDVAVTTNRGNGRFNRDLYALKRVRLSDKDNKDYILWMKFLGYYNLLRKPRTPGEVIPGRCPVPLKQPKV